MSSAPLAAGIALGRRSSPERVMRRILCIPDAPRTVRERDVQRLFSTSILLSAARCLLSYIVLPVASPAIGAATGIGPAVGLPLGVVALVFDVRGIRRFWLANHRLRWVMTAVYAAVMALVVALVVRDVIELIG